MDNDFLTIERTINLGNYNNIKIGVAWSESVSDAERTQQIIALVLDTYEAFVWHKMLGSQIIGDEPGEWESKLEVINQLRETYNVQRGA
jgi:hypothetical protein